MASQNLGKVREIGAVLGRLGYEAVPMRDAGVGRQADETGSTYAENAEIKARHAHALVGGICLSDDSGIEVECLGGFPGLISADFGGRFPDSAARNAEVLRLVGGRPFGERGARFVCAMVAVMADGSVLRSHGELCGYVAPSPMGAGGFGYDPIFYVPEFYMTTAQMSPEAKDAVSHRGKALRAMAALMEGHASRVCNRVGP